MKPNNHHILGNELAKSGELDEAILEFQRAIKFNPTAEAFNDLGNTLVLAGTGIYIGALSAFQ